MTFTGIACGVGLAGVVGLGLGVGFIGCLGSVPAKYIPSRVKHLSPVTTSWQTNKETSCCTTYTLRAQSQFLGLKWHEDMASYRMRVKLPDAKTQHFAEVTLHSVVRTFDARNTTLTNSTSTTEGPNSNFSCMLTHMQAQAKLEGVTDLYCPAYSPKERDLMQRHGFEFDHQNELLYIDIMHKRLS